MGKHRFPGDYAGLRDHRGRLKSPGVVVDAAEVPAPAEVEATEPVEPVPPVDENGLRTDGPTLAEFVAAGYSAENYPPEGYASKEPAPAPEGDEGTDAEGSDSEPDADAESHE